MSNIEETIERYESVCKEMEMQPNTYILKVMDQERGKVIDRQSNQTALKLAGNNRLMTDTRLSDKDAEALYKTLRNNVYINSLDLRYNCITDEGAEFLAKLIEESTALRNVNIMCNDIEEKGAAAIAKALHINESLVHLRLNGNKIGNKGGMFFAQALQINETMESLDLGDTDLKTESVIALATVLAHNQTLKSLNVNRPILFSHQEETTVHFAKMLKVNRTLKELHLMKYDMRDFGLTRLSENLMDNFVLTYLNLSCNRFTRDGMKELAKLLKNNTAIETLDLSYNRLEDDGAVYLAEAIATYNTTLTTLSIVSNNISGRGLCAVADSLKRNTSITNIYIWGNNLEESACIAFAGLIDTGRLDIKNTDVKPYVVDGITILSELSHGIRKWYYWEPIYGDDAIHE